jgi:hypothetical protein
MSNGWRAVVVGVTAVWSSLFTAEAQAAGPPAMLTLTPTKAELAAGQTAPFTVRLLDASGAEATIEANSQVGFAVDVSSVAAVAVDTANPLVGNVTAKRPGQTALRAFYVRGGQQTNIFAAADLTVTAAPDGGVISEPDAANGDVAPPVATDAGSTGTTGPAAGDVAAADVSVSTCEGAMCGGVCANLRDDSHNCGTCGNACQSGYECSGGACKKIGRGCAMVDLTGAPHPFGVALFLAGVAAALRRRHRR